MIVCVCHGISDKHIREMVNTGVSSIKDIQKVCKAGLCCGICISEVRSCVDEELAKSRGKNAEKSPPKK